MKSARTKVSLIVTISVCLYVCMYVCLFREAAEQKRLSRSRSNLAGWLVLSSSCVRLSFSQIDSSVAMVTAKNIIFGRQGPFWAPFSQHLRPKSKFGLGSFSRNIMSFQTHPLSCLSSKNCRRRCTLSEKIEVKTRKTVFRPYLRNYLT